MRSTFWIGRVLRSTVAWSGRLRGTPSSRMSTWVEDDPRMLTDVSEPGPPLSLIRTSGRIRRTSATLSAPSLAISSAVITLTEAGVVDGSCGRLPATSTSGSSKVGGVGAAGGAGGPGGAGAAGDGAGVAGAAGGGGGGGRRRPLPRHFALGQFEGGRCGGRGRRRGPGWCGGRGRRRGGGRRGRSPRRLGACRWGLGGCGGRLAVGGDTGQHGKGQDQERCEQLPRHGPGGDTRSEERRVGKGSEYVWEEGW